MVELRDTAAVERLPTREVHPEFSEAPHLRSFIYLTKTMTSAKNRIASRRIIPWPTYTTISFFRTRLPFGRFWVKEPRQSETIRVGMCYLYRRTRLEATAVIELALTLLGRQSSKGIEIMSRNRLAHPQCLGTNLLEL